MNIQYRLEDSANNILSKGEIEGNHKFMPLNIIKSGVSDHIVYTIKELDYETSVPVYPYHLYKGDKNVHLSPPETGYLSAE